MTQFSLSQNQLLINGTEIDFPVEVEKLKQILGPCRHTLTEYNQVYTWDDIGVTASSEQGVAAHAILIDLTKKDYAFSPTQTFAGTVTLHGEDIIAYRTAHKSQLVRSFKADTGKSFLLDRHKVWFSLKNGVVEYLYLSGIGPDDKPTKPPEPAPVDEKYKPLESQTKQWIAAVTRIVSPDNRFYNLTHGITKEAIADHSQIEDGPAIPDELVNFYKVCNVDYDPVTSAFSFLANDFEYYLIPFDEIARAWESIQDLQFGDGVEASLLEGYSKRIQTDDYANPRWIPFADGFNGDYLVFDTDPGAEGTFGQIIELQNESWSRDVVADSLMDLLKGDIALLEGGGAGKFDFILETGSD